MAKDFFKDGSWDDTLWLCQQFAIENGDRNSGFNKLNMVDLSIVLCDGLPEGSFHPTIDERWVLNYLTEAD